MLSVTGGRLGFICTERACVVGARQGGASSPPDARVVRKIDTRETKMVARFSKRLISTILR